MWYNLLKLIIKGDIKLIRMATHTRDFSNELVVRDSQHIKKSICRDRQETYPILLELLGTCKAN